MRGIKLPYIYLKPGEMYIAEKPTMVSTVLGSCISVTMFNQRLKIGAISHVMLPLCKSTGFCTGQCHEVFKYVDCSIRHMIKEFDRYGIKVSEIEVKLFGGANILDRELDRNISVGAMNIKAALQIIQSKGLKVTVSDVGGYLGRKIYFYTHTGEVLLSRLKKELPNASVKSIIKPCKRIVARYGR